MKMLPQNFRDAVLVTRMLGLRYLWIDCLCIIQDDDRDWQKESAIMASVYHNAYLTIAATASKDKHGGLLQMRNTSVRIDNPMSTTREQCCAFVRHMDHQDPMGVSPLRDRGWIVQEILLSRRIVYFSKSQLRWHCRSRAISEDGWFDGPRNVRQSQFDDWQVIDFRTSALANASWWACVKEYSGRQLTKKNDKLAAIAGVTEFFRENTGRVPIIGLWKDSLLADLLWYSFPLKKKHRLTSLPSWSWTSIDGPVERDKKGKEYESEADVLDVSISWTGRPMTSAVSLAEITLRTRRFTAVVSEPESVGDRRVWWIVSFNCCIFTEGWADFDILPVLVGAHVTFIIMTSTFRVDEGRYEAEILIITPAEGSLDDKEQRYRRVGTGTVWGPLTGKTKEQFEAEISDGSIDMAPLETIILV